MKIALDRGGVNTLSTNTSETASNTQIVNITLSTCEAPEEPKFVIDARMSIIVGLFFIANLVVIFIRRVSGGATASFFLIGFTLVLDISHGGCCGPLSIGWMFSV
jgi:hypothetical protein